MYMDAPQSLGYFSVTLSRFDCFIREKDNFATILAVEYFLFFWTIFRFFLIQKTRRNEKMLFCHMCRVTCVIWHVKQGCQTAFFKTKNPNLNEFWRALQWKMLVYVMVIWSILRPFGVFYDHLVHFVFIWYIFPTFGIMYQEKSGNPDLKSKSAF
jgi:hypothetical protein